MENPSALLKRLRDKLKTCESERKEYLDGWQRTRADYANAEKRLNTEKESATARGEERILEDLFLVYDDFERAAASPAWAEFPKEWRSGLEGIRGHLSSAFGKYGLEIIKAEIGSPFDPAIHNAVSTVKKEENKQEHTIAILHQAGFRRGERVIRPAQVSIFE